MRFKAKFQKSIFLTLALFMVISTCLLFVSCKTNDGPVNNSVDNNQNNGVDSKYNSKMDISWSDFELSDEYIQGYELSLPNVTATVGADSFKVEPTVVYPDGKISKSSKFKLTQLGEYSISYNISKGVNVSSITKNFNVKPTNFYFKNASSTYSYYKQNEDGTYTNAVLEERGSETEGLIVNLAQKDTVVFSEAISVDDLSNFIELYVFPEKVGSYDFSTLKVTLTDALDESVYLTFQINRYMQADDRAFAFTCVSVGGNGTDMVGLESGRGYHYNDNLGAYVNPASFCGQWNWAYRFKQDNENKPVKNDDGKVIYVGPNNIELTYDEATGDFLDNEGKNVDKDGNKYQPIKIISWANPTDTIGGVEEIRPDETVIKLTYDNNSKKTYVNGSEVADLDDPNVFKNGTWGGFKSDKVRLSVTAGNYMGSHANFVISKAKGQILTLNESEDKLAIDVFEDKNSPILELLDGQDVEYAIKDKKFKLPNVSAYDWESGVLDVTASVYYYLSVDKKVDVSVENGFFTPTKSGTYEIVYKAKDFSGNITEVKKIIATTDNPTPIVIDKNTDNITEVEIGEELAVKEPLGISGGYGEKTYSVYAICGDQTIEVKGGKFIPEIVGTWEIKYVASDYLGQEGVSTYNVECKQSSNQYKIIDTPKYPNIVISDTSFELPYIKAIDYSSGRREETVCKVRVEDANGTKEYTAGEIIVPTVLNNREAIKLTYFYGDASLDEVEISCIKPVIDGKLKVENYIFDNENTKARTYLDSEDAEFYDQSYVVKNNNNYRLRSGVLITAKGDGNVKWTYANTLLTQSASIEIDPLNNGKKYNKFAFVLTDSVDASKKVTLTIDEINKKISVEGLEIAIENVTLAENTAISYNNSSFKFNDLNIRISEYDGGEEFKGFPSGKVILSVELKDAEKNSGFVLASVAGNTLSYQPGDSSTPNLILAEELPMVKKLNDKIVIPSVIYSDCYVSVIDVKLTVKTPSGTIVKDKNGVPLDGVDVNGGYEITFTEFGDYTLEYSMEKSNWFNKKKYNETITISVVDDEAPVITLVEELKKQIKFSSSITLPSFTVSDNLTESANIKTMVYVMDPSGDLIKATVKDGAYTFTPLVLGDYQYVILAIDENGNIKSEIFEFELTK